MKGREFDASLGILVVNAGSSNIKFALFHVGLVRARYGYRRNWFGSVGDRTKSQP